MPHYRQPDAGFFIWADCACDAERMARWQKQVRQARAASVALERRTTSTSLPAELAEMTFASFAPQRLTHGSETSHPLTHVQAWAERIVAYGPHARSSDPDCPPQALYLYSHVPGCGKTHLAAAALHAVAAQGQSVAFVEELSLYDAWCSVPFEERAALIDAPVRAFLTVIDDLGAKGQVSSETLSDLWGTIIHQRAAARRWTLVTSNWSPSELVDKATLAEPTRSRLVGMFEGRPITLEGSDQRRSRTKRKTL
jgi:hypothetical protein